jgi:HAD superfamily hydrolase (TIGR01509 family)
MIAAVIFDMDGTLFDSSGVCPAAYIDTFAELGAPVLGDQDIIDRYVLGPPPFILADVLGRPASSGEVDLYHSHLRARARDVRVYAGVVELLDELAARGVTMAVFTGASTTSARLLLEPSGLLDRFAVVVGTDEVAAPKPDPCGIVETCARLGVAVADALYVGDSPLDQLAARAAGSTAVAAAWGHLYDATSECDLHATAPADVLALVPESEVAR